MGTPCEWEMKLVLALAALKIVLAEPNWTIYISSGLTESKKTNPKIIWLTNMDFLALVVNQLGFFGLLSNSPVREMDINTIVREYKQYSRD